MSWKSEYKSLFWIVGFFLLAFYLPLGNPAFQQSIYDALALIKWYAQEHVILCLVPAFFIAGTIAVFVSQSAVNKYFGAGANKWLSYGVASISGSILAVCSCTVLPLFSGIHKRGAGLGPAIAFLYSGPAINILAIILTARVLGWELGVARVIGAVLFAIIIGLLMHLLYRKEEHAKAADQLGIPSDESERPMWQTVFHFVVLVGILVFATWGEPAKHSGIWAWIFNRKWLLVSLLSILLGYSLIRILKINWRYVFGGAVIVAGVAMLFPGKHLLIFSAGIIVLSIILSISPGEPADWMAETWGFTKQIMPLLGAGVLIAGFLLGAPDGGNGIIPQGWIIAVVGSNSVLSNAFASVVGAFMYFATLTEIPILQGLLSHGMNQGPALALLLAGPAVSLPNLLVIRSVIGTQKTAVFFGLVVLMATISGYIFGAIV